MYIGVWFTVFPLEAGASWRYFYLMCFEACHDEYDECFQLFRLHSWDLWVLVFFLCVLVFSCFLQPWPSKIPALRSRKKPQKWRTILRTNKYAPAKLLNCGLFTPPFEGFHRWFIFGGYVCFGESSKKAPSCDLSSGMVILQFVRIFWRRVLTCPLVP